MGRRVMVVCAALMVLAGCSQDRALAVSAMNKGLEASKTTGMTDAIRHLKEAVSQDKTYADPAYYLGLLYHQKANEYDKAIEAYRDAVKRAPDNAQFHYQLGSALALAGKHDQAIEEFAIATKAHPNFSKAWFRQGVSLKRLKKNVEAINALTKSIEAEPDMKVAPGDPGGAAYHELGDLYVRYRMHDKALAVYQNGISNNAAVSRLYRGKGVAELKLKKFEDAESSFRKAIEVDPNGSATYFNLAIAQQKTGRIKQALKTIDRYLQIADPATEGIQVAAAGGLRAELQEALEKK